MIFSQIYTLTIQKVIVSILYQELVEALITKPQALLQLYVAVLLQLYLVVLLQLYVAVLLQLYVVKSTMILTVEF